MKNRNLVVANLLFCLSTSLIVTTPSLLNMGLRQERRAYILFLLWSLETPHKAGTLFLLENREPEAGWLVSMHNGSNEESVAISASDLVASRELVGARR